MKKTINQAVKRNIDKFPADFYFQLIAKEFFDLRSQSGTLKGRGYNIKYLPYVFSEEGELVFAIDVYFK